MNAPIEELRTRRDQLKEQLGDPEIFKDVAKIKQLSIQLSRTEKELELRERLVALRQRIRENRGILQIGTDDEELKELAQQELYGLEREVRELEEKLEGGGDTPQNLIMEIRAGAGGDEASLFARELFDMYSRFAEQKGWQTALLDESKTDLNGYKEVVFEVLGEDAYRTLRWESGVHRVQRIPSTEKTGRIHTSTISVAVLPKAEEVDLEIRPQDIKIEFFRSSGPGGQNVNKVETAVRIYHLPTGLVVVSQNERSQQQNREKGMSVLRSRLLDAKLQQEAAKRASERKLQIGTGDRSEKIRTYNYPQDRVTDHRLKQSWHNLPSILEGNIGPIVDALNQAAKEGELPSAGTSED